MAWRSFKPVDRLRPVAESIIEARWIMVYPGPTLVLKSITGPVDWCQTAHQSAPCRHAAKINGQRSIRRLCGKWGLARRVTEWGLSLLLVAWNSGNNPPWQIPLEKLPDKISTDILSQWHNRALKALYTVCQKRKPPNFWQWLCKILTDFKNSFTGRLSWKFAIQRYVDIPPHLTYVATLPCET